LSPLRRIRQERRLTTTELGSAIGVHNATISRIELGKVQATPKQAEDLVRFFGQGITELEILYPERYAGVPRETPGNSPGNPPG
jgi:transcriptional regulator with XRE-family HTH domain